MRATPGIAIEPVVASGCDEFFRYLNDHHSENGKGEAGYFLPLSKSESQFPPDRQQVFRAGLDLSVGAPGWRRLWVARAASRQIIGHVDLRSYPVKFAQHRCLLGIGVDHRHRRRGVATAVLSHAIEWARANTGLEWLDLQVLTSNDPAMRLYLRTGFVKVGEVPEMFRIDGQSFSETRMAMRLRS
jgi:RimJ/RimL family protein N-acetyltransferase